MDKRKKYSREFKVEAVRLLNTSGESGHEIEADLGIGSGSHRISVLGFAGILAIHKYDLFLIRNQKSLNDFLARVSDGNCQIEGVQTATWGYVRKQSD